MSEPKQYLAIMLSSTFKDLEVHRQAVITALGKTGFMASVMENSGARADADVIDASLQMVRDAAAYIGVISHRYGQTPECKDRNPGGVSITELEFNEAMRLRRPILLFVMSDDHAVKKADVEDDPVKKTKLAAFLARAKQMQQDRTVHRVYETFDSVADFSTKAATAIGVLSHLPALAGPGKIVAPPSSDDGVLPRPPELAAMPRYLGSHPFIGRQAELDKLADWCAAADPNPVLLFEAMGGTGKSILTWEWLTKHAAAERTDWAGRFWYSFYEKGAVMADFCRQALIYMTGRKAEDFSKLRTPELADRLLAELERRAWLLVLDGLERVLVAYHRFDAAQLPDEAANNPVDQIGTRNVRSAIRPEDDDLLRRLAGASPSKILVSTRLTPATLLNQAGLPVPGVRREVLPGLRPQDAEAMIRACGVRGESAPIQAYLQTNCDCHPLVIGALAGLINTYPPDRGSFDRWKDDARHGAALDLGKLDLVQKRNHILQAAIDALSPTSRALLQTLALLQGGADYATLEALNPHLPLEPAKVQEPTNRADDPNWSFMGEAWRASLRKQYESAMAERRAYLAALAKWKDDPATRLAGGKLDDTIRDLEQRGLLQYDANDRRYDLHPVVRGVTSGRMATTETQGLGGKVVDYFTSLSHGPWDKAESLDDLAPGLQVMRVLLRMNKFKEAFAVYNSDLSNPLTYNLNAQSEIQTLLKPFFPEGWEGELVELDDAAQSFLLNDAALALSEVNSDCASRMLQRTILLNLSASRASDLRTGLANLGTVMTNQNRLAESAAIRLLALDLAEAAADEEGIFSCKLDSYVSAVLRGDLDEADRLWRETNGATREWNRRLYRPGDAEHYHVADLFRRGELTEPMLAHAEGLAAVGQNHLVRRGLLRLRGEWHLSCGEPARAATALKAAITMAREAGADATDDEALLALAQFRAGEPFDAKGEAERLNNGRGTRFYLAELWHALGEHDRALAHALKNHRGAVADGEPYVRRYELDRTRDLLQKLGAELPEVPRYDASKAVPFPWEADVWKLIEKLRAERAAKEADRVSAVPAPASPRPRAGPKKRR